jgi:murein DD-endopeptidase MepM/ murein hydrolase activator NlpD
MNAQCVAQQGIAKSSTDRRRYLIALFSGTLLVQASSFLAAGVYPGSPLLASMSENIEFSRSEPETSTLSEDLQGKAQHPDHSAQADVMAAKPKKVYRSYELQYGDTLSRIWSKNGASYQGAILAADSLRKAGVKLNSFQVGEKLDLLMTDTGEIRELRKRDGDGSLLELRGNLARGYRIKKTQPIFTTQERKVIGNITSSFSASAAKEKIPYPIIDALVDLFSSQVEFRRNIHPGDSYSVLFEEKVSEDGNIRVPGVILAASITSDGKMFAAIRHVGKDGEARYYDSNGEALGNYFLRYPLQFSRISSTFSTARFHPILKRSRPHNGIDFAAPIGTPVRAVADGVITVASYRGGNGKMVQIRHGSRWQTAYLHLSKISTQLRPGARVQRGDVIGNVGTTGLSTGPHLHFSLYDNGRYVDPLAVKLPKIQANEVIPPSYLEATLKMLKNSIHRAKLQFAGKRDEESPA